MKKELRISSQTADYLYQLILDYASAEERKPGTGMMPKVLEVPLKDSHTYQQGEHNYVDMDQVRQATELAKYLNDMPRGIPRQLVLVCDVGVRNDNFMIQLEPKTPVTLDDEDMLLSFTPRTIQHIAL